MRLQIIFILTVCVLLTACAESGSKDVVETGEEFRENWYRLSEDLVHHQLINDSDFTVAAKGGDDNLSFYYIPSHDDPRPYFLYYAVGEEGQTVQIERAWKNISRQKPAYVLLAPYSKEHRYAIDMAIKDKDNNVAYAGEMYYNWDALPVE
ncbi:MAG: hypothetical protein ACOCWQ_01745 [Nanoarchaeota archaeon]